MKVLFILLEVGLIFFLSINDFFSAYVLGSNNLNLEFNDTNGITNYMYYIEHNVQHNFYFLFYLK
jgi:hypothetical protein